jgi:hypothetical protein
LQDFDPQDVPTEVGVGTSVVATPCTQHHMGTPPRVDVDVGTTPVTQTGTPPRVDVGTTPDPDQHMPECAQDVVDAEHGIAHFEACFPGSSHVTSMGTLPVTFLVNDELIPMKIEKLPGI